ncbi:hypothetical protein KAR91_18810 [Candidatus Pacearchaeota archaeon]|nr:hypothetical protein [Candidatus Pacearchaeota archaeon]
MAVTVAQVIEAYIKTRDDLAAKTKVFNETLIEAKAKQVAREKWMLGQLNTQDVDSIKAKFGTCFGKMAESVTVEDPDALFAWVHKDWDNRKHFLTNACSKGAVKQTLEDKKPLPPGVKYTKVKVVQVRKK